MTDPIPQPAGPAAGRRPKPPAGLIVCLFAPALVLPPCALTAGLAWLLHRPTRDLLEAARGPSPEASTRLVLEAPGVDPPALQRARGLVAARLDEAGVPARVRVEEGRLVVAVEGAREAEARAALEAEPALPGGLALVE